MNGLGENASTGVESHVEANETRAKNPSPLFWIALLIAAIVVVYLMFS